MTTRPRFLSLVCIVAGLAAGPGYAADLSAPAGARETAAPATGHQWQGGHRRHHGELRQVLAQLNLTPEQQTQIKSIVAQSRSDFATRHASARANHEALTAMSPNDPGYPAMLAAEKANAAARVQAASDIRTQIYAVLTPDQQAQIPTLIATERAARKARAVTWRSEHAG